MKWTFTPIPNSHVSSEVTQRDNFDNDDFAISETIVRETIQNSLDASDEEGGQIVEVNFNWISVEDGLDPKFFESLFKDQIDHAKLSDLDLDSVNFNEPKALVIEDFGTVGLTGKIDERDEDNFTNFWRNHGSGNKTGKKLGRHGLGKLVYSATSGVGAFFGVTCRREDREQVHLMGQTCLNLRTDGGEQFPPHAFFGDRVNEGDQNKLIIVPIKDDTFVNKFRQQFKVNRRVGEPGLSIIIPFPNKDLNLSHMVSVSIANYFYAIVTGRLKLKFGALSVDKTNVREMAKKYARDRFPDIDLLFDFVEEISKVESKQTELFKLNKSWFDDKKLDADDFDAKELIKIRSLFKQGELIGLSLPITLKPRGEEPLDTRFSVYLKKPTELTKGNDIYVRSSLTIPGEAKFKDRKALGAMIAEEEAISEFLANAENEAHTLWAGNTSKLKKNYLNPRYLVAAIKVSVVQLYDLLAEEVDEEDKDAFIDDFYYEEPEKKPVPKKTKRQDSTPPPPSPDIVPEITSKGQYLEVEKTTDGYRILPGERLKDNLPKEFTIEAAHSVGRGNPFQKYSPLDFNVGKNGSIKTKHSRQVKLKSRSENKWTIEIKKLPFKFEAKGFDTNRDLEVRYKPL
ncbi:hypothetical protein N8574_01870 [Akkermansiaceae bacterium]|nr:hypothetical protein [Akkermansiaceae bacterium]